jgi:cytochrome P450
MSEVCPRRTIDFDHHSAEFAQNAVAVLNTLREKAPIAYSPHHDGFWVVLSRQLGQSVLADPETFSSAQYVDETGQDRGGLTIPAHGSLKPVPNELDPPEWRSYRQLLNRRFAPAAVNPLRPRIAELADGLIDTFIQSGEADLVLDLANPLPALVTLDLLGIDRSYLERFSIPFHDVVAAPAGSATKARALDGITDIRAILRELIRERRQEPRDDYISEMLAWQVGGQTIDDETLSRMILNLLGGGIDTTTALLSNAFFHLDEDPELRAQMLSADTAALQRATEEFLRYYTPIQSIGRTAVKDYDVDGQRVCPRDRVLVSFAAMNRDPAVFDDPDAFDPQRPANRHASFGLGIHRCLGSNLARAMFQITLMRVLHRLPDYRVLTEQAQRYESLSVVNGWARMPVTFTPGSRSGIATGDDAR